MRRAGLLLGIAAVFAGAAASASAAGGPPILVDDAGLRGVATATGFRYVALEDRNQTVVARISPNQRVVALRFMPGRFTIPAVANDGSPGGLSADGKTLVLIQPRFSYPRARTSFLILDPRSFRVHSRATLRGDFSFDAISPDGSTIYFIQYTSPKDPTRYAVRAFDTTSGQLLSEPIVDRAEPDEDMRGNPITRATSADGRWAYTLYDGGGEMPFIHALDTVGHDAHCIDLDALAGNTNLPNFRLRLRNGTLAVVLGEEPVLTVDRQTFTVGEPKEAIAPTGNGWPWMSIALAVGAVLLAGGIAAAFFRRGKLALGRP